MVALGACARASDRLAIAARKSSPPEPLNTRAVENAGRDAAPHGTSFAPAGGAATGALASSPDGGVCAEISTTVSSCTALRALIAAARDRPGLRACLDGGAVVAPPPGNQGEICFWESLAQGGRDCFRGSYDGEAVRCLGDEHVPADAPYDGFKRMATECLAGWDVENREESAGRIDLPRLPSVEFKDAVTDGEWESVTHVQGCKRQVNGEEIMAGGPPAYDLVIDIFTTRRKRGAAPR